MRKLSEKIHDNANGILKVVGLLVAVVIVGLLFVWVYQNEGKSSQTEDNNSQQAYRIEYNGQTYELRDDIQTVLIIGIDKYLNETNIPEESYLNTQQADFLVLVIIDSTNKTYTLLQINRDTMTPVRQLGVNGVILSNNVEQLALSHTYGNGGKDSCQNTVVAIENLLFGTEVNHYLAMTMDAIPVINDDAGGVSVEIKDDFSQVDPSLEKGKTVKLKGDQSLLFVRARGGMVEDKTNIARMERQLDYIDGLIAASKKKMKESSKWAAETVKDINKYISTDMSAGGLTELLSVLKDYEQSDILKIEGEVKETEYVEFYPDQEALKAQVVELMYKPVS